MVLLTLNRPVARSVLCPGGTVAEMLGWGGLHPGLAHPTADHAGSVCAFFGKRPPVFKG